MQCFNEMYRMSEGKQLTYGKNVPYFENISLFKISKMDVWPVNLLKHAPAWKLCPGKILYVSSSFYAVDRDCGRYNEQRRS